MFVETVSSPRDDAVSVWAEVLRSPFVRGRVMARGYRVSLAELLLPREDQRATMPQHPLLVWSLTAVTSTAGVLLGQQS
jgi:hypothetical protein